MKKKIFTGHKIVYIFLIFLLITTLIFFFYNRKSEITLEGEFVCLPHRDTTGPVTLECTFGFMDKDENYYLVHEDDSFNFPTNSSFQISGLFKRGSHRTYKSIGTIKVENAVPLD